MKLTKYNEKQEQLFGQVVSVSFHVGRNVKTLIGRWSGDPHGKFIKIRQEKIFYKTITEIIPKGGEISGNSLEAQ
jgi:hypothetical protein